MSSSAAVPALDSAPPVFRLARETPRDAGEIYEWLAPRVLGYIRSQGIADPEAALGDVFVRVTAGLPRFSGDAESMRRWVFVIAHSVIVDDRRRAPRRPELRGDHAPEERVVDAHEPVDDELVRALGELTDLQRHVVVLRFVADLSLEDVAKIVHRPVVSVKALQARALRRLRASLGGAPD